MSNVEDVRFINMEYSKRMLRTPLLLPVNGYRHEASKRSPLSAPASPRSHPRFHAPLPTVVHARNCVTPPPSSTSARGARRFFPVESQNITPKKVQNKVTSPETGNLSPRSIRRFDSVSPSIERSSHLRLVLKRRYTLPPPRRGCLGRSAITGHPAELFDSV